MEYDIPGNKDLPSRKVKQLVAFLTKRVPKEDTGFDPSLQLILMTFGNSMKTETAKCSDM